MLKVTEFNQEMYALCPACSRMYADQDEKGRKTSLPAACMRCGCPMDEARARDWLNRQAEKEHDPALAAVGARLRGMVGPPADAMQRPHLTK